MGEGKGLPRESSFPTAWLLPSFTHPSSPFTVRGNHFLAFLLDKHFQDLIPLANIIDHIEAFHHFAEAGMVAIQVGRILAAVANEELGATRITAGMCHREHPPVVILIIPIQFAVDGIAGATSARPGRVTALDHEIRDHAMEGDAIVEAVFGEFHKISDGIRCILIIEFHLHIAFLGLYGCFCHK
jgi:hypothetical protein